MVLPPDTYNVTGSFAPVISLPISMCAILWFMPINGVLRYEARARAAVAPVRRHGPKPGPCEKAIASIWLVGVLAFSRALCIISPATSAWCLAASLGWIPPSGGMKVLMTLARILPSEVTIPTLKSSAVLSMPRQHFWVLRVLLCRG